MLNVSTAATCLPISARLEAKKAPTATSTATAEDLEEEQAAAIFFSRTHTIPLLFLLLITTLLITFNGNSSAISAAALCSGSSNPPSSAPVIASCRGLFLHSSFVPEAVFPAEAWGMLRASGGGGA
jgi:hypothetical protein